MPQQIEVPGMGVVEFPDGMNDDQIAAAIKSNMPAQPDTSLKAKVGAFASSALDSVPVIGPAITAGTDRIAAFGGSLEKGTNYADELARIQGVQRDQKEANPYTAGAGGVAGAVLGTAPLIAAAPAAFGAGAGPLLGRAGASAVTSGILTGADSTVRNGGDLNLSGKDALTSGVIGFGVPYVGAGVGKAVGAFANRVSPAAVPTAQELKAAGTAAYDAADQAGIRFSQPSFQNAVEGIASKLQKSGLDRDITPKSMAALSRLQSEASVFGPAGPTLSQVDTLRKVANGVAGDMTNKTERSLGNKIINGLDDFVSSAKPSDVVAGDPVAGAAAIREARSLWAAQSKAEIIAKAVQKAERNAGSTGSGGNIDNALRQGIKSILNSDKKSRGFTEAEKTIMEEITRGSKAKNVARLAGKLSPSGNGLALLLHGGAAAATGGLSLGAAVAGAGAKKIADASTRANVDRLARTILNRGALQPSQAAIGSSEAAKRIAHMLANPAPLVASQRR